MRLFLCLNLYPQNAYVFLFNLGKINVLEYLITELGVDPLAKDDMGMCTVHAATQNKMFGAVKVHLA